MIATARYLFLYLSVFFSLLFSEPLPGTLDQIPDARLTLEECLLPADHPLQDNLKALFQNDSMFKSPDHLAQEGFQVNQRMNRGLMVAGHPLLSNYLIKKFENRVPQDKQTKNFLSRINGARALREFIDSNHLLRVTVPQKWLYPLPELFSDSKTGERSYVLIVEKMDILSEGKDPKGKVARKYSTIDQEILREVCIVLYTFRGLDSELHNHPFTHQNQIAFIDTEKWEEERSGFLRRIRHFLSKKNKKYADEVFLDLRNQQKAASL